MDDLLHLLHSDGADELRLRVGQPPIIVLDGEEKLIEGPPLTTGDTEHLLWGITDTRQRRMFRERHAVEFLYKFRGRTNFVVRAKIEGEDVCIVVH